MFEAGSCQIPLR